MTQMINFPDIGQYRNAIHNIISSERYIGKDEIGNNLYDSEKILGSITCKGTTKLHGTNSAICVHKNDYWTQSRENVITPIKDNAGFSAYWSGTEKKEAIMSIVRDIKLTHNIDDNLIVVLFGEWVGPKVQKNVAISAIPNKVMFLFGIRVVSIETHENGSYVIDKWIPIDGIRNHDIGLYNIADYKTWELTIDLNHPELVLPILENLVDEVEKECPVSKQAFNVSGIGEGIVWEIFYKNKRILFKTKGKLHSVTKHKDNKIATVDIEKMNSINEFVEYSVTEPRLMQGIEKVFTQHNIEVSITKLGDFLKWIVSDIAKEEIDTISKNNLSIKDVNGAISKKAREWFINRINNNFNV